MGAVNLSVWTSTESDRQQLTPTTGIFKDLCVKLPATPSPGNYIFTLMKNGSSTNLTVTVSDANMTCDREHYVEAAAGDSWSLEANPESSPTVRASAFSIVFDSTELDESILMGSTAGNNLVDGRFGALHGSKVTDASSEDMETIWAFSGSVSDLYVEVDTAPGGSDTWVFTAVSSTTCTISASATTCNSAAASDLVTAGTQHSLTVVDTGTPTSSGHAKWGLVLVHPTDGDFQISASSDNPTDASNIEYNSFSAADQNWTTTESARYQLVGNQITVSHMYIHQSANSGGLGDQYDYQFRDDAADAGPSCGIAGGAANEKCNDGTDATVASGSLITLEVDPTNTPDIVDVRASLLCNIPIEAEEFLMIVN
jgi:hypothetical protein